MSGEKADGSPAPMKRSRDASRSGKRGPRAGIRALPSLRTFSATLGTCETGVSVSQILNAPARGTAKQKQESPVGPTATEPTSNRNLARSGSAQVGLVEQICNAIITQYRTGAVPGSPDIGRASGARRKSFHITGMR